MVFGHTLPSPSHAYLLPEIKRLLEQNYPGKKKLRIFDNGCGKGIITQKIAHMGHNVIGMEPSEDGCSYAREHFPDLKIICGSGYDKTLPETYGQHDVVTSIEVLEHLYDPILYLKNAHALLKENGCLILSTPFHSYIKNMAISITGKWDSHLQPLKLHGHIKFFSEKTLYQALEQAGFKKITFSRVGRFHPIAKSMFAVAYK